MTLRAILWRVVPWTVTIGAAAACWTLASVWNGGAGHPLGVLAGWVTFGLCLVVVIGVLGLLTGLAEATSEQRVERSLIVAQVVTVGTVLMLLLGTAAGIIIEAAAISLLAMVTAIGAWLILATAAACTALYVGTSDKRRALRQEQRERLEREALR